MRYSASGCMERKCAPMRKSDNPKFKKVVKQFDHFYNKWQNDITTFKEPAHF